MNKLLKINLFTDGYDTIKMGFGDILSWVQNQHLWLISYVFLGKLHYSKRPLGLIPSSLTSVSRNLSFLGYPLLPRSEVLNLSDSWLPLHNNSLITLK